jgi:hypothetical protein
MIFRCTTVALCLLMFSFPAVAEEFGWRDSQGKPVPDNDGQKSAQGFGGKLLITKDRDWKEKWARPETPRFSSADIVKLGETITALVFWVNAAKDAKGEVHIRCDFLISRPDGSVSTAAKNVSCYDGPVEGSDYNLRLVKVTPEFIGEAGDLPGTWTMSIQLTDAVRQVSLPLQSTFEYQKP